MSSGPCTEGYPAVLTIAGSDSGGGAGIQADLKSFTALQCYGASVITALTAQNTLGVQDIHTVPPAFVTKQMDSVFDDIPVLAMKTGMLSDAGVVHAVADSLKARFPDSRPPLVCDPVSVSTSGHTLLQPDAVKTLISELIPLATVITPNKNEAELLLRATSGDERSIESLDDMLTAARELLKLGCRAVLVKGGHLTTSFPLVKQTVSSNPDVRVQRDGIPSENMEVLLAAEADPKDASLVVDVLCESEGQTTMFLSQRIDSTSTHGTGCTLSAAIACGLARGLSTQDAVRYASAYTHQGIASAFPLGSGHGPLNHMHSVVPRIIPEPTATNPHPFVRMLIMKTKDIWKQYVEHDFVRQLGQGTLPRESFIHFLKQDYIYLKYYSRAHGLLAAKSPSYDAVGKSASVILHIVQESTMHKAYCEKWGITADELENGVESAACTAYGAYILDVGLRGDASLLLMALAACLLGYGEVGLWLKRQASLPNSWVKLEGNPYLKWIEDYSGEDYQAAVRDGLARIEAMAASDPPSQQRFDQWCGVWEKCTRLEKAFWDMGLNLS
ncbi:hypothetical protein PENSPDRAFT_659506 [Peniophora sp. CONT]|nr:hypothetical protein PENSPDRAFT_659506 [Peniophora sp. CONT]